MTNQNYTSAVIVKMTEEMKKRLQREADNNLVTVSEYIRTLINKDIKKSKRSQ